ncbi:MAG TPA: PFL family protein, partial [Candidatus Nitrosotenuis sp.]|nr:PFL family protein [Candidatus Nitrosotenuis sp.]
MWLSADEVLDTLRMIEAEHLDVRTVTLGISLQDCAGGSMRATCERVVRKILTLASNLVPVVEEVSRDFGVPIVNKRLAVSPVAYLGASTEARSYAPLARALDRAAAEVGVDYIGGYSALVHKGFKDCDRILMDSIPEALNQTERVCSSISVASTRAGINMDAVVQFGQALHRTAHLRPELEGLPCARLVAFCNLPEDNPFVAGAVHGMGEAEAAINVGISGPGVIRAAVERAGEADLLDLAEAIKRAAFKITRMGELVGREVSRRLGVRFGIIDLSLAPTPAVGDSVAEVLEAMGLECCGTHGTTAALALLNDAVKKGGAMASSSVGGLSGAFIPLSEDAEMARCAETGALTLDKLEAMTSVCSVGLDMIAVPGDTPPEVLSAIVADEMAIGVVNAKTTAVRLLVVPGKGAGEKVSYGGLLGAAPIIPVHTQSPARFIRRGGRIPAPL